jgi:glucosamine-6-phosphate deaminase
MALTVGVQTIMNSRSVVVIATGAPKAMAVAQCVEGSISHQYPITALQNHHCVVLCVDEDATLELKVKTVRYFKGLLVRENELGHRQKNAKQLSKL